MLTKIPGFIQSFFRKRLWKVATEEKILYLTFDDGPIPEVTPWVLEQLKKHNAKATFFCIGDNIRKHPAVFGQLILNEHSIGNHTYHHLNGWKSGVDDYITDTLLAENIISSKVKSTKLFRPPYGKCSGKQVKFLRSNGFQLVMWDVLSRDYDHRLSAETCLKKILKHATSGSILVFHDSLKAQKNLKAVLPKVLEHFSQKGYRFEKII